MSLAWEKRRKIWLYYLQWLNWISFPIWEFDQLKTGQNCDVSIGSNSIGTHFQDRWFSAEHDAAGRWLDGASVDRLDRWRRLLGSQRVGGVNRLVPGVWCWREATPSVTLSSSPPRCWWMADSTFQRWRSRNRRHWPRSSIPESSFVRKVQW